MKRLSAALAALLAGVMLASIQGSDTVVSSAVVRVVDGQASVHENGTHAASNIKSVRIQNGYLVVRFEEAYKPVVHVGTDVDESFARQGFTCGGSGGAGVVTVHCNKPIDTVTGDYANIWLRVEAVR